MPKLGELRIPWFVKVLGFYSSVELTFVSWRRRSFLVGKILFNTHILRDPFLVEIPLIRINRTMQGISLHRYSWRPRQATLDSSAFSPRRSLASFETSCWLHRDDRRVSRGCRLFVVSFWVPSTYGKPMNSEEPLASLCVILWLSSTRTPLSVHNKNDVSDQFR